MLGWRCSPTVWQSQCDFACCIAFDVVRNSDHHGDRSWCGGAWHDSNAWRDGDVDRGRDCQQAALLAPRASNRDGLHGPREQESHAFDVITEYAGDLRRRKWQMEVLWLVDLIDVVAPFVRT